MFFRGFTHFAGVFGKCLSVVECQEYLEYCVAVMR